MAHSALVISREELELDSRFAWTAKLSTANYSSEKVIILHNSLDDDVTLLEELAKLYRLDNSRKFIYINSEPSPMLTSYFFGVGGIVLEDEFPLSDGELLNDIIQEYQDCEFKTKTPKEEFSDLSKAMERIISGNLDEDELHEILTSPDWLSQIRSSIKAVSTTLVRVDNSHKELAVYVDHSRDVFTKLRNEITSVKSKLENALLAATEAQNHQSDSSNKNKVMLYPSMQLPIGIERVLYIKELSPCSHLTSLILTYAAYLEKIKAKRTRVLIVQQNASTLDRYPEDVFYSLSSLNTTRSIPQDKKYLVTGDPTQKVLQHFFSGDLNCYIIIDRLMQSNNLLNPSPKVKMLYASDSISLLQRKGIAMSKTIVPCRPAGDGGINIPFYINYRQLPNAMQRIMTYYQPIQRNEETYYQQLDAILGIE